jgi:hypothetical protein
MLDLWAITLTKGNLEFEFDFYFEFIELDKSASFSRFGIATVIPGLQQKLIQNLKSKPGLYTRFFLSGIAPG